jgi:uroporphyrinogen-III decarboxylase
MNSRQRVERAVNHQSPDRVPIDLSAIRATGINAVVFDALKKRFGINTPTKIHDAMQIIAEVEMDMIERLHVDVLPLDAFDLPWVGKPATIGERRELFCGLEVFFQPATKIVVEDDGGWALLDGQNEPYARMPKDGYYFDFARTTMAGEGINPDKFQPSSTVPDQTLQLIGERARHLNENTDKAVVGWGACISMIGLSALLGDNITQGSLDDWMVMLMTEKQTAHDMMARFTDSVIERIKLYHQAVGDRCVAWGVASDDAGTQRGEFISPQLWEEMLKPHYRRVCDWVHQNTNWKTFLHSCGSVYHLIPHWIDAGIDIFNPVQISAANMEPDRLYAEFGGKIVFWGGGCETQHVLPKLTPDEVRQHVRDNLDAFHAMDGGYVFTQVHNIQQNVPVENVEAMLDAAYSYGRSAIRS